MQQTTVSKATLLAQQLGTQYRDDEVLLPYQKIWMADDSPLKIAEKSRRTGITWAEAGRDVINAAKPRRRGGCNTFYVGSKQEMALEYIAACALFGRGRFYDVIALSSAILAVDVLLICGAAHFLLDEVHGETGIFLLLGLFSAGVVAASAAAARSLIASHATIEPEVLP